MKHEMNVLCAFPSYENYEDRTKMLLKIESEVHNFHLHLHNPTLDRDIISHPAVSMPQNSGFILKWLALFKVYKSFQRKHSRVILHDFFAPRLLLFSLFRPRTVKVFSLYSDTANYFWRGRFKVDFDQLNFLEKVKFMRLYVFRTCYELLGLWIADGVIVNSPEILEGISQVYRLKKKALVIDTSIDVKFWKPLEIERDKKTIFFAGRLAKRKGIDTLLESFRMLYSEDKELKLILAGEASAEEPFDWGLAFLEKHSLKGAVTLTGHLNREKMREHFSSSAVFVLPSRQEGSPRVVKEALSCECPVITSSLPGCLSLDPDGSVINFLNDHDPIILKRLILKQLDENKTNDISYRKFVSKRFSKFQIAQATSQFYKSLVN